MFSIHFQAKILQKTVEHLELIERENQLQRQENEELKVQSTHLNDHFYSHLESYSQLRP